MGSISQWKIKIVSVTLGYMTFQWHMANLLSHSQQLPNAISSSDLLQSCLAWDCAGPALEHHWQIKAYSIYYTDI